MSETADRVAPLNWPALVADAVRRRKAEKLTQKEHAALASVSVPTMIAFERGERTLSLAKAFDILRVVGLVNEPSAESAQENFVREAFARWRALTASLPKDSPGRFPHGWYRIDYAIEGEIKDIELHRFEETLRQAAVRHTGWPPFWVPRRREIEPREVDGTVECWLAPTDKGDVDRAFADAAHCDFWRGAPEGRMFLMRGYQEDSQETFPAGTIFDTTLPIWRMGEVLLHAAKLNALIARNPDATSVRFRALYTGLSGRDLRAWASPMSVDFFGGGR
jgi:transcriptional regulator with XRE-family HTH domain